jgi:hypothetical protein
MREQLLNALVPLLVATLTGAAAWLSRALTRYLARRTYALDCAALRDTARVVVADLQVAVDQAKDPAHPEAGAWSPAVAASVRLDAIRRVRALAPLACRTVLTALDGDVGALDALLGAYVEDAVRSLRS